MLEKHRHTVSSLRGEPFPAALNGPLPCRPPNSRGLRSRLRLRRGGLNLNLNLNLNRLAPSTREGEKSRGDTKPAHRDRTVSKRRDMQQVKAKAKVKKFKLRSPKSQPQPKPEPDRSGYAYLPGSIGEEISEGLV
jgi:hypothetical protein